MSSEDALREAAILIVDDQRLNVRMMEKMLRQAGYFMIETTTDPTQTRDLFRLYNPDLVVLDLHMPQMNGFQVLEQLREVAPQEGLSVMVVSADASEESRRRAFRLGARDYMTTPIERHEFLRRTASLLTVQLARRRSTAPPASAERSAPAAAPLGVGAQPELFGDNGPDVGHLHLVRMSRMSCCLARAVGMSPADCDLLLQASRFHDIGMQALPERMLLTPADLTPDEIVQVRTHTTIGAQLLSGHMSPFSPMAAEIALTHHERWDGQGYPNGRSGEEIPLVGRVCALVDVFDIMTMDRPYRRARPIEAAIEDIRAESGKAFDPVLVDLFLKNLLDILQIKRLFHEKLSVVPTA